MTGDENDWHGGAFVGNALLQLEAAASGEGNVEHQAVGNSGARLVQKIPCRRECHRAPARGADQEFQRFSYRDVVINNEHDGSDRHWRGTCSAWCARGVHRRSQFTRSPALIAASSDVSLKGL